MSALTVTFPHVTQMQLTVVTTCTSIYVYFTSLLCYQFGDCIQSEVCLCTVCWLGYYKEHVHRHFHYGRVC